MTKKRYSYIFTRSARKPAVKVCTGQAWAARMKEDPNWDIYEKQTNQNRISTGQLQEEQKLFLLIILMCILQLELKMQSMDLQKTSKTSP